MHGTGQAGERQAGDDVPRSRQLTIGEDLLELIGRSEVERQIREALAEKVLELPVPLDPQIPGRIQHALADHRRHRSGAGPEFDYQITVPQVEPADEGICQVPRARQYRADDAGSAQEGAEEPHAVRPHHGNCTSLVGRCFARSLLLPELRRL